MKCKDCGNTTNFTMVREIASWNDIEKRLEELKHWDEYIVCDDCDSDKVDTENDY